MQLNLKVDFEPAFQHNKALMRQIPFIASLTVDRVAKDAQKAIQDSLPQHFTLRRAAFMRNTIKMLQFAKKHTPTAILGVDPNRDFLSKFERGGAKVPLSGEFLAVPIEARKGRGTIVPANLKPSTLRNKPGIFELKSRKGNTLLMQRVSKNVATRRRKQGIKATGPNPRLRVLYVLKHSVPIRPQLHFVDIAYRTAMRQFPIRGQEAVNKALSTARA